MVVWFSLPPPHPPLSLSYDFLDRRALRPKLFKGRTRYPAAINSYEAELLLVYGCSMTHCSLTGFAGIQSIAQYYFPSADLAYNGSSRGTNKALASAKR